MGLEIAEKEGLKELELMLEKFQAGPGYANLEQELKDQLKRLIPGTWDDAAIDLIAPHVLPVLKAAIAAQIEKISPEV
jgi:hypothetical protein